MSDEEIRIVNYPQGAAIVVQNAPNPGVFFIVRNGKVVIDSEHILVDHELTHYGPGDSFGLVSAFTEKHYLVTLFAETDVEVVQIPIFLLGSYLKERKELAMKILALYSKELRALQKLLSRANLPADREHNPEKLLYTGKTFATWGKPDLAAYTFQKYIQWAVGTNQMDKVELAEQCLKETKSKYEPHVWDTQQARLKSSEVLFVENENSNDIYVVLDGKVKLFSIVKGHEFIIDVLGAGEIFGEMSIINNSPRMASAVTESDSMILRVTPENLLESVGDTLLQKIFESIARRIWFSHQRLVILRIKIPVIRLYAYLYDSIRDQDFRRIRSSLKTVSDTYQFFMTLEDLCSLCGIIKIKQESIAEFLTDSNIVINKTSITVNSRKRLEEKLGSYKSKEGKIVAGRS